MKFVWEMDMLTSQLLISLYNASTLGLKQLVTKRIGKYFNETYY